jgi:hypothetical protein
MPAARLTKRPLVARLHALAAAGESFAFETTLASRNFAPWSGPSADKTSMSTSPS